MADQFEFELPNGQVVRTGTKVPTVKPLGTFKDYPREDLLTDDQIRAILADPGRKRSREIYGKNWLLNQGGASSCNLYACAGALMRARDRKGLARVDFAPEWGYAHINDGKDQGSMLDDGMVWCAEKGLPVFGSVPYESYNIKQMGSMEDQRRAAQSAAEHRYFEAYVLPANEGIETLWRSMVTATLRNEQVVLAVHVGNGYMYTENKPWAIYGFDSGPGNHAVAADDTVAPKGWRSVMELYLDQFGSWGQSHGEDGRGLLTPRHVEGPSEYHVCYAVRSATTNSSERCETLTA